jgi:predicted nucleotidyltransferase
MSIQAEKLALYRETARQRQAKARQAMLTRQEQAWAIARQAADLLRRRFDVDRVVLFGSLARGDMFHAHSDVDLAVWGLAEAEYLQAVSSLLDLEGSIDVDLVRMEEAKPDLRRRIEMEGKPI